MIMNNKRNDLMKKAMVLAFVALAILTAGAQGLLRRPGAAGTSASQRLRSSLNNRPSSRLTTPSRSSRTGSASNLAGPSAQPVASASAAGDLPANMSPSDAPANPDDPESENAESSGTASDLNFKDAPVEMMLEVYGKLVDRTVLKEPSVPSATITLESRPGQKLTREEQIEAIEVVLEMNGIHIENYGDKFVRAVPRKDARKQGIPLIMDPENDGDDSGKVVSMMIPFKNISAQEEAQKALEGFKSNEGLLQVFERTNSILVTDTRQNINRMLEIARAIDIATPVLENVFVRQIKNASATDIKTALETIVTESQKELEKTGKAQQNAQANAAARSSSVAPSGSLLRRPGRNAEQPQQPTSVESLVTSVSDADRGLIRGKVLILADERSNKLVVITSKSNMDFFDKVIEQLDVETTPDVKVEVIRLKYADAEDVSDMINDLIGNSASSKSSGNSRQNANQNSKSGTGSNLTRNTSTSSRSSANSNANQRSGESKAGELSKDNVTVLADKRINGLVVMARTEDMPTLHSIIESMDVRLSQVLIETVIIEVQLGDDLQTGVDWIQRGKGRGETSKTEWRQVQTGVEQVLDANGNITYQPTYEYKEMPVIGTVRDAAAGFMNRSSYALGGGGGSSSGSSLLQGLVNATTNAADIVTPIGGGINYFLKSDKLNLAAVIQASKTDNRSKYLASPVIMTVDNKEATIEATQMRYLFKGYQYSGSSNNGSPVPDYEQKELGITIKATPKINPNGTVMLTVEEEYSQEGSPQTIEGSANGVTTYFDAATTITRKLSADVVLENGQTVVFGGLTQTRMQESESGIPFLKDIPWIGKWLFGSVSQNETRQELLVFMTPYVLDDAEMAQAEAFRRKKALSDANPWVDHGWSASQLADPMSKKEMMRRLKDEWKKQDENRKTKLAIEKAKLERAKALEKMDEVERKFWIDAHRDELQKEEKERFDEFVKEQSDLKLLATEIREKRLEQAEAKIGEADQAEQSENEYGRLERERSAAPVETVESEPEEAAEPAPVEPVEPETPVEPVEPETPEYPEYPENPVELKTPEYPAEAVSNLLEQLKETR